jgi:signal transduction histidine kinase
MVDLLVDGAISEIPRWYGGNYSRSELVEGAYSATGLFPELGDGGKWLYFTAAVIRDDEGAIIGAVETLEDITERKHAEEQLQEAKRQAEMYLELMGHDINNMNQVGIGYLELALVTPGLDETVKHKIEKALESLDNSSRLIGNVQKLQRIPEMSLERVDAGKMLGEVCSQFAGAPGKAVTINCAAKPGYFVMANVLLRDVFMNIIGNAIKHSTGPLTINVSIEKVMKEGRDLYKVSIEDNGPGISPEIKEKLFTRFQRGQTHAAGKGLGLYLVRSLVDSYHGSVWAEDRVPGDHRKGSRFLVMLPALN